MRIPRWRRAILSPRENFVFGLRQEVIGQVVQPLALRADEDRRGVERQPPEDDEARADEQRGEQQAASERAIHGR